jgi:P27 family predicted phage terminase small subunit
LAKIEVLAMANRGRPRKSVEELKRRGTYRKDRHADRVEEIPKSRPEKPEGLGKYASWIWDQVVAELADKLTRLDTAQLWSLCEMWELYRQAAEDAKKTPTNRDLRISVTTYRAAFEAAASKFGLNPCDRQRLPGGQAKQSAGVRSRSRK